MKSKYIPDLVTDEEITDFFLVKEIATKVGANGKTYLDLTLADASGTVKAKKWDISDAEAYNLSACGVGDIVKIAGKVSEWNNSKQIIIKKIRKSTPEDDIEINDYVKAAPEPPEKMYAYILGEVNALRDEDLKRLCLLNLEKNKEKLMYWPAASKNHHAEKSGLLWHVTRMLRSAVCLAEIYSFLDADLLVAGVVLHDIEKLTEIESDKQGVSGGYSVEGYLLGHIVQGVKVLDAEMRELGFPDEKRILVEHMILSHHGLPEFGSPQPPKIPEAEMLHQIDTMDARMYDFENVLSKIKPGTFSEKVYSLERRRIYRRTDDDK